MFSGMNWLYVQRTKFSQLIPIKGPSKMIFDKVRTTILKPLKLSGCFLFKKGATLKPEL